MTVNNNQVNVINLMRFDVVMYTPDGSSIVRTYKSSGNEVKFDWEAEANGHIDGFPVYVNHIRVRRLPPFHPTTVYIVPLQVMLAHPERPDLISPDTQIGAIKGMFEKHPVGFTRFFRVPAESVNLHADGEQAIPVRSDVRPAPPRAAVPQVIALTPTQRALINIDDNETAATLIAPCVTEPGTMLVCAVDECSYFAWWDTEQEVFKFQEIIFEMREVQRGARKIMQRTDREVDQSIIDFEHWSKLFDMMQTVESDLLKWTLVGPADAFDFGAD